MKKIKVMSIFGTRPEAIKMAPLIKELEACPEIESSVLVTAQHREMLDQVLEMFGIVPDYDLDIMKRQQSVTEITTNALMGIEEVLKEASPDLILVHGDTSTTFSGALAAFYNKIRIGHVEAGLRTYDKYRPFPEEMNRKLTGALADIHFAPTRISKENLLRENIDEETIFVTGNTSIDTIKVTIKEDYTFKLPLLNEIDYENKKIITMTAHRRENIGSPLMNICKATLEIADSFPDCEIIYAVHPNPAVRDVANEYLSNHERIHLTEPLSMMDMHNLLSRSYLVMTDSGGLQEEVPSMGKPVLVLRDVTERPEGVQAGTLKIAGTEKENIVRLAAELLSDEEKYEEMAQKKNPFGDGEASERIVESILYYFGLNENRPDDYMV